MNLFRYISFLFQVLLAAVLGTNLVFANTGHWETEIFSTYHSAVVVQVPDLTFASQTPPFDSDNIASTGAAFAQTGEVRRLDGAGICVAALAFDGKSIASNIAGDVPQVTKNRLHHEEKGELITGEIAREHGGSEWRLKS